MLVHAHWLPFTVNEPTPTGGAEAGAGAAAEPVASVASVAMLTLEFETSLAASKSGEASIDGGGPA